MDRSKPKRRAHSEVVMKETVLSHLLILSAWTSVVGIGIDADAATGREKTDDFNVLGVHKSDKVLHNRVDTILVEITVITETEEVQFQGLGLHHAFAREIVDAYLGEIRLTGDGTQRGEFGTVETHPVVVVGMAVLEGLEDGGVVVEEIVGFLTEGLEVILCARHAR